MGESRIKAFRVTPYGCVRVDRRGVRPHGHTRVGPRATGVVGGGLVGGRVLASLLLPVLACPACPAQVSAAAMAAIASSIHRPEASDASTQRSGMVRAAECPPQVESPWLARVPPAAYTPIRALDPKGPKLAHGEALKRAKRVPYTRLCAVWPSRVCCVSPDCARTAHIEFGP